MSDTPRSIIDPTPELVKPDKMIISPEEAKRRVTVKAPGGKDGYKPASRAEAISIACQIGQQVYDQLREEHAATMANLQKDLAAHFADIRQTFVINILDLQRRSFSYRIRAAFEYDCQRIFYWVRERIYIMHDCFVADWDSIVAWLELHGLREPPANRTDPGQYVPFTKSPAAAVAGAIAAENGEPIAKAFDVDVDDIIESPEIASSLELHVNDSKRTPST